MALRFEKLPDVGGVHSFFAVFDYNLDFAQILGQQINDFILPDVNLIGEHSDAAELGRMLQLILGCAVNCEQKQGQLNFMEKDPSVKLDTVTFFVFV